MATVKKCDICGDIYDVYPTEKTMNIFIQDGKSPGTAFGGAFQHETNCCPTCTSKILGVIDTMKAHPEAWGINVWNEGKTEETDD